MRYKVIWNKRNPYRAEIAENKLLSGINSEKEIRHYEINLGDSGLIYKPGDTLCVIPINNIKLVNALIKRLKISSELIPIGYEESIFKILENNFEIIEPTKRFIEYVNKNINHAKLRNAVDSGDRKLLNQFKFGKDMLDFMNLDKTLEFKVELFLELLKPIQHRSYSISSSYKVHHNEVHLTVSTLRWKSKGRYYNGVCSTYLSDKCIKGSKVNVFIIPNHSFRLPQDTEKPIIMIGPGTGVAPFRSFLEERKQNRSKGKNWLFYGGQTRTNDFIYENDIVEMQRSGYLHKLDTAFSRDQEDKIYVQHKMYEARIEFFKWLEEGAYIYVCGDANYMAKDVDQMLYKIVKEHLSNSGKNAKEYIQNLKKEKIYLLDVY